MPKGDIETFHKGTEWHNRVEGSEELLSTHATKERAETAGRQYAVDRKVEHVIKKLNGQIAERHTYGDDPSDIPG